MTTPPDDPVVDPLTLTPADAALYHLTRAATIIQSVTAEIGDANGYVRPGYFDDVFTQATVHAHIGTGYATLAAAPPPTPPPPGTDPRIVYPNG